MKIKRYEATDIKDWYIATGIVKGRRVFGAGITHFKALQEALKS